MDKYMVEYLVWRFTDKLKQSYRQYCMQWINNVTTDQLQYFKLERERLIKMGIYHD